MLLEQVAQPLKEDGDLGNVLQRIVGRRFPGMAAHDDGDTSVGEGAERVLIGHVVPDVQRHRPPAIHMSHVQYRLHHPALVPVDVGEELEHFLSAGLPQVGMLFCNAVESGLQLRDVLRLDVSIVHRDSELLSLDPCSGGPFDGRTQLALGPSERRQERLSPGLVMERPARPAHLEAMAADVHQLVQTDHGPNVVQVPPADDGYRAVPGQLDQDAPHAVGHGG